MNGSAIAEPFIFLNEYYVLYQYKLYLVFFKFEAVGVVSVPPVDGELEQYQLPLIDMLDNPDS